MLIETLRGYSVFNRVLFHDFLFCNPQRIRTKSLLPRLRLPGRLRQGHPRAEPLPAATGPGGWAERLSFARGVPSGESQGSSDCEAPSLNATGRGPASEGPARRAPAARAGRPSRCRRPGRASTQRSPAPATARARTSPGEPRRLWTPGGR